MQCNMFPRIHIPERGVCISSRVDATSAVVREWCPCSFVTRTMPIMSPPVAINKASATRNELKTLSGILAEGWGYGGGVCVWWGGGKGATRAGQSEISGYEDLVNDASVTVYRTRS